MMGSGRMIEIDGACVDLGEEEEGEAILAPPSVLREMQRTPVSLRDDRYEKGYVDALALCMDLRGFSSYARDNEPELVAAFLEKYSQELLAAVNGFSASYYKLLGDGALIIWDRADADSMAACVELFRLLDEVVDCVAVLHGSSCALAGAVTQGSLYKYEIFGECSGLKYRDYIGYAINIAFRLQSMAGPGELLGQAASAGRFGVSAAPLPPERRPSRQSIKGMRDEDYEGIVILG
jgi:class 3 adenylate cyclase